MVNPVVIAMVGKPLIKGVPIASAVATNPPPLGGGPDARTTPGTVTVKINGGCTIGPNNPLRCTTATASRQPRK